MILQGWEALKAHIDAHPVEGSPAEMRAAFAALAPDGPEGRTLTVGGVPCREFGAGAVQPLVWLHGGGLVFGSAESHAAIASAIAHRTGRRVLVPDYRLAPEHPWPAPLDDISAVLDALPDPVDLVGDSVGGQLAILAALRRPDHVRKLGLISPNTDRTGLSQTRVQNSDRDAMNDDAQDLALAQLSFGEELEKHPDASPVTHDLRHLPPIWMTAATNEVLLDDTLLFAAAAARAGVPVEMHIEKGLCHLWVLWPDALEESVASLDALAAFISAPQG